MNINTNWIEIFNKYNNEYPNDTLPIILNNINSKYLNNQIKIYPSSLNIFKAFNFFNIEHTKVVILGQDPYHNLDQANGLAFGCNNKPPPSLRNISSELLGDLGISISDYSLEKWAKQGILLLNTALTVIQSKPSSHIKYWSKFTNFIINELNNMQHPIIFVAWGAYAYDKLKNINLNKHHLIVSSHPSPLSVFKKFKKFPSFAGSKPFSKINSLLDKDLKINW